MIDADRAVPAPQGLARCPQNPSRHCLLCNSPAVFAAVYVPGEGSPVAPPPGKGRMVLYSLCESCAQRLDVLAEVIEARIENEIRQAQR